MADRTPLSREELVALLDQCLEVELTFRNTAGPAESLATLTREEQDLLLDLVRRMASTYIELGFQVAEHGARALRQLDPRMLERWVLHAADWYNHAGLRPPLQVIREVDSFARRSHERAAGVVFEEEAPILLPFVHALAGRRLQLEPVEGAPYTDTERIFLPAVVARLPTRNANFLLYKAMVAFHWAQARYGTFRIPLAEVAAAQLAPGAFLALFGAMEAVRLEACLARELPGLYRDMQRLLETLDGAPLPPSWSAVTAELTAPEARPEDSLHLAQRHLGRLSPPPPRPYQGRLDPEAVAACMQARLEKEKARFRVALQRLLQERPKRAASEERPQATVRGKEATVHELDRELLLEDEPVEPPEQVAALMRSIVQDLGEIPPDYLVPAGPGEYDPSLLEDREADTEDVWSGTYHEEGAFLYPEWDFRRKHYRKNWCAVREKTLTPRHDGFAREVLHKYGPLVKQLRKTFEGLRDEDRVLKRQVDGDGVDIDALVEALADARDGREMSDRLFTRLHRSERNIAAVFLVDMSGSTKGWINEAEREALILLCEAVEALGDRYAIYGFSGMTRKRCELYVIKRFEDTYDEEVRGRISAIEPQDYTRMGFAIRHLNRLLAEIDARTRILITLSDGKPDDYSDYRGEYGIEDTRRALLEARRAGIHPFCITIDREGADYLRHMYGPVSYTVLDEVRLLPLRVADIYRRLTTP
jgi:nitric oxide reductase NorD protein